MITSAALSADGRLAVSGGWYQPLRLWDLASGTCLHTFESQKRSEAYSLSVTADFQRALTVGSTEVRLWDIGRGSLLKTFNFDLKGTGRVAMSRNGRCALIGGFEDSRLRLLDLKAGQFLATLEDDQQTFYKGTGAIAVSEDGQFGLSAPDRGDLVLWDLTSKCCVKRLGSHNGVQCVAFSPDARYAISASSDSTLRLWDFANAGCARTFCGHTAAVRSVAIAPNGHWAVSGGDDGTLRFWDVRTGRCLRTLEDHADCVDSVALSSDGRWALSASGKAALHLWDLGVNLAAVAKILAPPAVCCVESANEANRRKAKYFELMQAAELACAERKYYSCAKLVLEARSIPGYEVSRNALDLGRLLGRFGNRKACRGVWRVGKLEESRGETPPTVADVGARWMFGGHGPWSVKLWNVSTRTYWQIDNLAQNVTSADMTPDGRWVLMGSLDGKIRLVEVGAGRCLQTLEGHSSEVTALAISVTGGVALSASKEDGTVRMWDLITGRCLGVCEDFANECSPIRLIISPDEQWALSVNENGEIEEWLLGAGGALWAGSFKKNIGKVTAIALSSDGRWVLSGNSTGAVQLWEIESASCVCSFEGHTREICSLGFSADGRCALSTSGDGTLQIWEVATGHCQQKLADNLGEASLSGDAHWLLRGDDLWEIDWDYEFPEPAAWAEGAEPYLKIFLTMHCPLHENGYERIGKPVWADDKIQKLMTCLQTRGYGWLKPDGVRKQLKKMTNDWKEPPKAPGLKRWKQMLREMSEKYPDLGIQVRDSTTDG